MIGNIIRTLLVASLATFVAYIGLKEEAIYKRSDVAPSVKALSTADVASEAATITRSYRGATSQSLSNAINRNTCLTPYDFGAIGDSIADDTASIKAWLSTISTTEKNTPCLYFGVGKYRVTSNLSIEMPANSTAPVVRGGGAYSSGIYFDSGLHMVWRSTTAMFYSVFEDFSVTGSFDGPLVQFSTSTNDALNGARIVGLVVNNGSTGPSAVGIQYTALYNSRVFTTANCRGHGVGAAAHKFVAGTMNSIKISGGNCNTGLWLAPDGTNDFAGNNFDAIDVEEVNVGVKIDNPHARTNIFLGGILSYLNPGDVGLHATAGIGNIFKSLTYGGRGALFGGKVGIIWENPLSDFASALSSNSFASGVEFKNTSAQPAFVNIVGGVTSNVTINNVSVCVSSACSFILMPEESFVPTFSSQPTAVLRAIRF